jgi:hypothetical protein
MKLLLNSFTVLWSVVYFLHFLELTQCLSQRTIERRIVTKSSLTLHSTGADKYFSVDDINQFANLFGLRITSVENPVSLRLEAYPINDDQLIGYLTAFIRPIPFRMLQLDTIQVKNRRQTLGYKKTNWTTEGSTITFIMGSIALRWAYDRRCAQAELLAVKDSEKMHRILVRLYKNFGFEIVRDVGDDSSLRTVADRLLWGAVGTLMKIDIEQFLEEWTPKFQEMRLEKEASLSSPKAAIE